MLDNVAQHATAILRTPPMPQTIYT